MKNKSGVKTMLMSVLMSTPGPLIVGLGLLIGQSSTQLADFIRRSIELLAIIFAFVIYLVTTKKEEINIEKKVKLEFATNIFVGSAMIICGIIMLVLAFVAQSDDKGNVIPGLCIALLGVVANTIFWFRYRYLGKKTNNNILLTQSNLYRAKSFVDLSVVIALSVVLITKNDNVSYYFDLIGTCCVSLYLTYTGIHTLIKELITKKKSVNENYNIKDK